MAHTSLHRIGMTISSGYLSVTLQHFQVYFEARGNKESQK